LITRSTILALLLLLFSSESYLCQKVGTKYSNLLPTPVIVNHLPGEFILNKKSTLFNQSSKTARATDYLIAKLKIVYDLDLKISKKASVNQIQLIEDKKLLKGNEAYSLEVSTKKVIIRAAEVSGFFYAIQTLLQLLPDENFANQRSKTNSVQIPCGKVIDSPKYSWRSFMLDSGRQYQTVEFIKRYLDYLAIMKMNVFHWHLTEGQGWRIEIKKYPKLTEVGSMVASGEEKQGFYSQKDIREVIEYAKKLCIQVVPEIDVPGHSEAALIAYPELTCSKKAPTSVMEYTSNLFCGGSDETYTFLQNVLDEVCELFPSEYIHLGGDEAPKDVWDTCKVCQAKIKSEGLKNSHELQLNFSSRLANYLKTKGKKVILWGDVVEQDGPKLPDNVIIYWWNYRRKKDLAYQNAIKNGYQVICGSNYYTYLNFPITPWSMYKQDRTFDMKDIYEGNPSNIENPPKQVLGMGTCLWTDWNVKMSMIDQRVFPRVLALAEQMWSNSKIVSFEEFYSKVKSFYPKLSLLGIIYGPALREEIPEGYSWE